MQGVFYRASVEEEAGRRRVAGEATNLPDGTVEVILEGDPDAVAAVLDFCERGPSGACVEQVDVASEEPEGLMGFTVR